MSNAVLLAVLLIMGAVAGELRADPDPTLTPGAVEVVDKRTVCAPGYATRVRRERPVPPSLWVEIARAYDVPLSAPAGTRQRDHFIPITLGGCPDCRTNLWFQPAEPRPGYHEKDWVEVSLAVLVCAGRLSLEDAQARMRSWAAIWLILHPSQTR